jgi:hypothetical protein
MRPAPGESENLAGTSRVKNLLIQSCGWGHGWCQGASSAEPNGRSQGFGDGVFLAGSGTATGASGSSRRGMVVAGVGRASAFRHADAPTAELIGDRERRAPAAEPTLDDRQRLGLNRRSKWRVQIHPARENAGRDEPPLSAGRGENHTSLRKGGYFRKGS